jgi:transcriptional regulator with XRE-family HTH domain
MLVQKASVWGGREFRLSATKIQELRAEGLTLRDIAKRCRVFKTTVIRALNQ